MCPTKTNSYLCFDLNQKAVYLMQEGKYAEAIEFMKIALRHLRSRIASTSVPVNRCSAASEYGESAVLIQSVGIPTPEGFDCDDEDCLFSLYLRAFVLKYGKGHGNPELDRYFVLAVLLYNMAIAQHFLDSQNKKSTCTESLSRTLNLYTSCMGVLKSCCPQDVVVGASVGDFHCLLLALANNMGYIHSLLYNFMETRECISLLGDLLECPSAQVKVPPQDFCHFFVSIFTFLGSDGDSFTKTLHLSPAA